jgi:hypothetical protein
MKQLLVRVMLICSTAVTTVFADPLDAGLDADRSSLSRQQIAARSASLEASTSLSPLRFPQALSAPRRIFNPDIWRSIEAAADAHDLDPMILAGMIFIESDGDPLAKSPIGPAGIAQLTKGSARDLAHGDEREDDESFPLHGLGWAFDVPTVRLSKRGQRDLKFILTDLRQSGPPAYVKGGGDPTCHVVRHPDHAMRFEPFYEDVMAGLVPAEPARLALAATATRRQEVSRTRRDATGVACLHCALSNGARHARSAQARGA